MIYKEINVQDRNLHCDYLQEQGCAPRSIGSRNGLKLMLLHCEAFSSSKPSVILHLISDSIRARETMSATIGLKMITKYFGKISNAIPQTTCFLQ